MCINLSCTKAENAHLFLNQMIDYKSLLTYIKEWFTRPTRSPSPRCLFLQNESPLSEGGLQDPHLLDWSAYKRGMGDKGREGPNSGPKAGVLCSPLGGWAASSQRSPPLLSPSSHLSWANAISMLLFLTYLSPLPTHVFFYLGRRAILKKISGIFTPKYLIHISKKKKILPT